MHKLLSVLTSLGEQLHQIARMSEAIPESAKHVLLGQTDLARAHTAFGRLGSLLSLPTHQQVSPITLAEHGICNTRDTNLSTGLRFFQQMTVRLDNIYDLPSAAGSSQLQAALEAQFKSNLMLRGFDTWNVPLHRSLNSMPPLAQSSGVPHPSGEITSIQTLPVSDFVMTGCHSDGSINVWATRAGLTRLHTLNFKRQAHIEPGGSLCKARLHFLDFECDGRPGGVKVFVPKGEQKSVGPSQDPAGADQDEGDGEFMAALFDEEAAAALGAL